MPSRDVIRKLVPALAVCAAAVLLASLAGCATPTATRQFKKALTQKNGAFITGLQPYAVAYPPGLYEAATSVMHYWADRKQARRLALPVPGAYMQARMILKTLTLLEDADLWVMNSRGDLHDIKRLLREGIPPVVALQASDTQPQSIYFVVVAGYDDSREWLLCHDGNPEGVATLYPYDFFMRRWQRYGNALLTICPPHHPGRQLNNEELLSRAVFFAEKELYRDAREDLLKLEKRASPGSKPYLLLGNITYELGDRQTAEHYYNKALEQDTDNAAAMNNLAYLIALDTQRLNEAERLCEKALALQPENPNNLDTMGFILLQQNQSRKAAEWLEKARDLGQRLPLASRTLIHEHLALAYLGDGQEHLARQVVQDLLRTDPEARLPNALLKLVK